MKHVELEKLKGEKIANRIHHGAKPDLPGHAVAALSRREQRKLDQAQGLVPFSTKLDGELVKKLQALAQERKTGLTEVVTELLEKGLAA